MGLEFKVKILLYCFWKMKSQQGFDIEIRYLLCNVSGKFQCTCNGGVVVSKSELQSSSQGSFSESGEYEIAFQF